MQWQVMLAMSIWGFDSVFHCELDCRVELTAEGVSCGRLPKQRVVASRS